MDNKEIYKKTITFSIRRLLWDIASLVVITILGGIGFAIGAAVVDKSEGVSFALIGLLIGAVIGIIVVSIASHFISYVFKAGQIAMMTKGITEGKLPDDVYAEGKKVVKERFVTVAVYYMVTRAITGIFNQIGRGITAVGQAVGGDNGGTIGSIISSIIQTIVRYLCDCCLGWVFYMKDESAVKATLQGAALFFKKGKTLLKNLGRIFGISALSLLVIGGVFFGITYLICMPFPDFFQGIANAIAEEGEETFLSTANGVMLAFSGIIGLCMWGIIHSTFVRPYILIGVLRNFIESGKGEKFSDKDYEEVAAKSPKFKKLQEKA